MTEYASRMIPPRQTSSSLLTFVHGGLPSGAAEKHRCRSKLHYRNVCTFGQPLSFCVYPGQADGQAQHPMPLQLRQLTGQSGNIWYGPDRPVRDPCALLIPIKVCEQLEIPFDNRRGTKPPTSVANGGRTATRLLRRPHLRISKRLRQTSAVHGWPNKRAPAGEPQHVPSKEYQAMQNSLNEQGLQMESSPLEHGKQFRTSTA